MESSHQIFDFARKAKNSEYIFSLMCDSASYILHAIARVDEVSSKDVDEVQQWNSCRDETFQKMKKALHEWIIREDVIGGYIFGGSVPQYGLRRKSKGKEELQVYTIILISYASLH